MTAPETLPRATRFTVHEELQDPLQLMRLIKSQRSIWAPLRDATTVTDNWGRGRDSGWWALAYVGFTVSSIVDMKPWWSQTNLTFWREAGFLRKPGYSTVYERFVEMEGFAEAFEEAAAQLVQLARRHEPRVGQHLHGDSTEAETHAALVHDCELGAACMHRVSRAERLATRPQRVSTGKERDRRHAAANQPAPDLTQPDIGDADRVELREGYLRVRIRGHWFRSRDVEAGIRAYMGPHGARKFWHGYYNGKLIDHFTGGVVACGVYNASHQEYSSYPDLYARARRALGADPQSVVADKGYSVTSVFEHNTKRGVASVMPWRTNGRQRHDKDTHDRHGTPRCKHCGGTTTFVRFSANGGKPRLWFDCQLGHTAACTKTQTISCSKDWRLLLPLWRTDAQYHELRASHDELERLHRHWRERYKVGGDCRAERPKRIGRGVQQLRASAAVMVEWLRINWRHGWLPGSVCRNQSDPIRPHEQAGHEASDGLRDARRAQGLTAPYGAAAAALGIGRPEPPSRR